MEILAHKRDCEKQRRHHLAHCIIHFTLEVATLALAIATLCEVEKLHQKVMRKR